MEKIYWASTKKSNSGVTMLISDKVKAKPDLIKRDREGNYIFIKGSIDNEGKYQYLICMQLMV